MVENWWLLGRELQKIEKHQGNAVPQGTAPGVFLGDLGINYNQSSRSQQLAETDLAELQSHNEGSYD